MYCSNNNASFRELGLFFSGGAAVALFVLFRIHMQGNFHLPKIIMKFLRRKSHRSNSTTTTSSSFPLPNKDDPHIIRTVEELRRLLPPGRGGDCFETAKKILPYLDDQMMGFIKQSPFLQLATVSADGQPFVSPKGDEPGFVSVIQDSERKGRCIIIPDRPGNRLLFGLQNILLASSQVAALFEIPGTCTTLRCQGMAHISTNPQLLNAHTARKCRPKIVIVVNVEHAFFHCAKAYMRSRIWDPDSWPLETYKVGFGQYFAKKDSQLAQNIDSDVNDHYKKISQAILGKSGEIEP